MGKDSSGDASIEGSETPNFWTANVEAYDIEERRLGIR